MTGILADWRPEHAEAFGARTLKLHHRLAETGLFEDEALAALIERTPPTHYNLNAMNAPEDARMSWTRGLIGSCRGEDVIRGVREGRLWLNLRRLHEVDESFARLLEKIFTEFEAGVPGLSTFRHNIGVLISSPRAQVHYHADVPGQALWQVRGRKRIYIYPNVEPFLRKEDLEDMILGLSEEEIPYDRSFDAHAEIYDLEPGEMLLWALNGPHRVVNENVLNVSVTTEHFTPDIRMHYAVRYANAVLRRSAGLRRTSNAISGPSAYAKAAITAAHRTLLRPKKAAISAPIDFTLDESGPRPREHAAA
jgi:hypothetical protein